MNCLHNAFIDDIKFGAFIILVSISSNLVISSFENGSNLLFAIFICPTKHLEVFFGPIVYISCISCSSDDSNKIPYLSLKLKFIDN